MQATRLKLGLLSLTVAQAVLGCSGKNSTRFGNKAPAQQSVAEEFEAFVVAELNDSWDETATNRIFRFCRVNSEEATRIILKQAAKRKLKDDPYLYHRVGVLAGRLPLTESHIEVIPRINKPISERDASLASGFYVGYLQARPLDSFYIPEDVSQETSPDFANFAFNGFDLHRSLVRYATDLLGSGDENVQRTIREAILLDHVFADLVWKYRNRYEIDPTEIARCRELMHELSTSEFWWIKRYLLQVERSSKMLRDLSLSAY